MAWTQADLDRIDAALARGEKTIQWSDRSTTYRSVDEMLKVRAVIAAELGSAPRVFYGTSTKGLQ